MKIVDPNRNGTRREPVSVDALRIDEIWADFKRCEESLRHVMAQLEMAADDLHFVISIARYRRDKRKRRKRR